MIAPADEEIGRILAEIGADDVARIPPPAGLWDDIAAEVATMSLADDGPAVAAPVTRLAERRRSPLAWIGAAAASAVIVVGALLALDRSAVTTVSEVALSSDGLTGAPADLSGRAELRRTDDGLEIDLAVPSAIDTDGGYLELWLIDTDVVGMVSLGPLNDSGRYPVPDGVDPGAFPVVDISVEPADGVPTHSGRSVLRGVLDA